MRVRQQRPFAQQQIGRLDGLAAGSRRVDGKIGKQRIFRRDTRQHNGLVALVGRNLQRPMRRVHEHAGMAVEDAHHIKALAYFAQQHFRHLRIGLMPRFAVVVEFVEVDRLWVGLLDEILGRRVGNRVHHDVRVLNMRHGFQSEVSDALDAGAGENQPSGPHAVGESEVPFHAGSFLAGSRLILLQVETIIIRLQSCIGLGASRRAPACQILRFIRVRKRHWLWLRSTRQQPASQRRPTAVSET